MTIDSLTRRVNKTLGEGTLLRGRDVAGYTIPRITSGSLALDLSLGGGWPLNHWIELMGNPSNGKSVLAYKTVAMNMALNPKYECLWVAGEPFVVPWAISCGIDMKRMTIADTKVMEEGYEIAVQFLAERAVDAVVIDSLSSLVPTDEDEKPMGDWQVGLGARLTSKFMRKSNTAMRRSLTAPDRDCLCMFVSQWRSTIGGYGDQKVTPNGQAKEFFSVVRMEVKRDEWIEIKSRPNPRVGLTLKTRTVKNKTAPPQRVASVDFYWEDVPGHPGGEYDTAKQLATLGMDLGVVELAGSYYNYAGQQWQGKEKFTAAVLSDQSLQDALDHDIRTKYGVPILTGPKRPRRLRRVS